jgi:hypothetical protein
LRPAFLAAPGVAPANVRDRKEAASALTGAASCISILSERGNVLTNVLSIGTPARALSSQSSLNEEVF